MTFDNLIAELFEEIGLMVHRRIEDFADSIEKAEGEIADVPEVIRKQLLKSAREAMVDDGSIAVDQAFLCLIGACSLARVWMTDRKGDPAKLNWPPTLTRRRIDREHKFQVETSTGVHEIGFEESAYAQWANIHSILLDALHRAVTKMRPEALAGIESGEHFGVPRNKLN